MFLVTIREEFFMAPEDVDSTSQHELDLFVEDLSTDTQGAFYSTFGTLGSVGCDCVVSSVSSVSSATFPGGPVGPVAP